MYYDERKQKRHPDRNKFRQGIGPLPLAGAMTGEERESLEMGVEV